MQPKFAVHSACFLLLNYDFLMPFWNDFMHFRAILIKMILYSYLFPPKTRFLANVSQMSAYHGHLIISSH